MEKLKPPVIKTVMVNKNTFKINTTPAISRKKR